MRALIVAACLFAAGCGAAETAEPADRAFAAAIEMNLRIAEQESDTRGTSAFTIIAWAEEQSDVEHFPLSDSVLLDFPDGSTLNVEFYTETMRVRGWEVR